MTIVYIFSVWRKDTTKFIYIYREMFHMFLGGVNSCSTRNLECVLGYKLYQLLVKLKEIIKEMILILEL